MARRRFFVESTHNARAVLTGEDARHLVRVLRVEPGQEFEISDNESAYLARVERAARDEVWFAVVEKLASPAAAPRLALLPALIKFERFEWMLEKSTELGAETIQPVVAERSEKGLDIAAHKRLERWRRIVRESSQQARRVRMPEVLAPVPLADAVRDGGDDSFFLEEEPGSPPIGSELHGDDIRVLIGPEGGWTDRERAVVAGSGWKAVSLGPNILRAETAAIAALAILGNAWRAR